MTTDPRIGPVSTVWHTITRRGKSLGHFTSDLIFVDAIPTIVFEWQEAEGGELPTITAPLDPAHLHRIDWDCAEYMYEFAVEDPREVH